MKDFPEFDPAEPIDEDKMKSADGKKRWRDFMMAYENKVDDYSFGTILRKSPKEEYTQDGTIFGMSTKSIPILSSRISGILKAGPDAFVGCGGKWLSTADEDGRVIAVSRLGGLEF